MAVDYMTARERELIRYLLHQDKDTPVADAAAALAVSSRTVHRDLKGLGKTLRLYNLNLIKSAGKGVRIEGSCEDKQELELSLLQPSVVEYTAQERRTLILCRLLESVEPLKLQTFAAELKVTSATISYDLDQLETWFETTDLSLTRRRGYGVTVSGSESAKRAAMSSLIAENFGENDLFRLMRENIKSKNGSPESGEISQRLLGLVEQDKWLTVEKILADMKDELPYHFADSAYVGLVVHLTLAIERISQGEKIEINDSYLKTLEDTKEHETAVLLIEKLEKVFQLSIPKAEVGYITMHLRGAKIREDQDYLPDLDHLSAAVYAKALMDYMQSATGQPLKEDDSLYQGLVAHLDPALYRISENMRIYNPLLDQIKTDYEDLFLLVTEAVDESLDRTLPESEVGYLTLHFGSALEKLQNDSRVNALVVCSSGIGSSKMLMTRLRKEIPEIEDLKNISMMDLQDHREAGYDIVISTMELSDNVLPYIVVNPFLTKKDIEKVKLFIRKLPPPEHSGTPVNAREETEPEAVQIDPENVSRELRRIEAFSTVIVQVMETFRVLPAVEEEDLFQVLTTAETAIKQDGVLHESHSAAEALWNRYQKGGTAVPHTNLALFHARTDAAQSPCFLIQPLHKPLRLKAMDDTETDVMHLLILLAPDDSRTETYDVLSVVSEQLVAGRETLDLFASADEDKIKAHLGKAFRQWLKEKL
ncbi:BglG family transcription antiterminator [Salibacterium lacus]|uniref:BglG family transcription antiterminator n=1 Tax=Salibacterium lacus TaxID=1898109 RepID=A0ABW5T4I4_9BACI